ncbi:MAG: DUF1080 domain-containing protein [Kiritimatiellae bacterium]|nr:DUF1080 domain-containing protein [Kiritimatiellia bacterium]
MTQAARFWSLPILALLCASRPCTAQDGAWQLAFHEDFAAPINAADWQLDGNAKLAVKTEGETSYLEIDTANRSVLWLKQRFDGDVRLVFRARGQSKNRSIVYWNANPTPESGCKTVFGWTRPDADMGHYAGTNIMHLYSVGILRDDLDTCYVRHLGGATASLYPWTREQRRRGAGKRHDDETGFASCPSPFFGKPDTWFAFDLQMAGKRITLAVDGKTVLDVEDPGKTVSGRIPWRVLTNGGWIAFRNFKPTKVDLDYLRVYERGK